MILELLLSAAIDAVVDLAVRIGLEDKVHSIKERLLNTDRKTRQQAMQRCLQEARRSLNDGSLGNLLEQRPVQQELAAVLLDPGEVLNKERLAPLLGAKYPSCIPDLVQYQQSLQAILTQDPVWGPIITPVRTLRYQDAVLAALKRIDQKLEPRQIVDEISRHFYGPTVFGDKSVAAEKVDQVVYDGVGQINFIIDKFISGTETKVAGDPRKRYLREMIMDANRLPWAPIHEGYGNAHNEESFDLVEIFTDLDTTELEAVASEESYRAFLKQEKAARRLPAFKAVDQFERLLILGDPGSGKTTLVKYLVYHLAQAAVADQPQEWLKRIPSWNHDALFPVWLEMRRFSAWQGCRPQKNRAGASCLLDYVPVLCSELHADAFADELSSMILDNKGKIVFIFDGLDEVAREQRQWVMAVVNDFVDRYSGHRYVATCRPYAYLGQPWLLKNFRQVSLAPFSPEQIDHFVRQWYDRLLQHRRFSVELAELRRDNLQQVVQRPDLAGLAERPLLLTIMANLHAFRGQLPDDRTELYADAVKLLLERWERERQQPGILDYLNIPNLKMDDLETALYEAAFAAHSAVKPDQPTADLAEETLRKIVQNYLGGSWDKAGEFIEFIRERAGLLIRHKNEAYTFPHRTFQEYLAACYLAGLPNFAEVTSDLIRKDWQRWREVFVLSCGVCRRSKKLEAAIALVNKICPVGIHEKESKTHEHYLLARLASEGLYEAGLVGVERGEDGKALLKRVKEWLLESLALSPFLGAPERAAAGSALARIGDPRKPIVCIPEMHFVRIPSGMFIMGSKDDTLAFKDEKPQCRVSLEEYWISLYPVSQAQYRAFEEDHGYENPAFWPEAIAHGIWKEGQVIRTLYKLDSSRKIVLDRTENATRHRSFGLPYDLDNHPVVGVCWYEAMAFCYWLTDLGHRQKWLNPKSRLVLPSEAEWEKAARGGLKLPNKNEYAAIAGLAAKVKSAESEYYSNPDAARLYPWDGQEIDGNKANYDKAGIKTSSPLGCFNAGNSPYGCGEMSGNVWEWTRSLWGEKWEGIDEKYAYPYEPGQSRENLTAGPQVLRCLRGGSFNDDLQYVRCAYRLGYNPDDRDDVLGFRVVLLPL